jgi:hypothetical protein
LRTTARITAFSPGQSPPPVRTPMRMLIPDLCVLLDRYKGSRQPRARLRPGVNRPAPVRRARASTDEHGRARAGKGRAELTTSRGPPPWSRPGRGRARPRW